MLSEDIKHLKELTTALNDKDRELEESELKLRKHCAMMQGLCDHLPVMVWAKGLDRNYLFANKLCCEQLLNTTSEEVIGKNDMFFANRERTGHPGKDYHTFGETCDKSDKLVLQNKSVVRIVESGFVKGKPLTIEVKKIPFLINGGTFVGIVGIAKDVTGLMRRKSDGPIHRNENP